MCGHRENATCILCGAGVVSKGLAIGGNILSQHQDNMALLPNGRLCNQLPAGR
jgi:hypothetical protein